VHEFLGVKNTLSRCEVFAVVLLKIQAFWDVMPCCWDCLTPTDEDTMFLQNVRDHLSGNSCVTFKRKKLYVVIGCHSNSQHTVWGSTNCNDNRAAFLEILNSTNLGILNEGNVHKFCTVRRLEVIDITLGCFGLLESFKNWEVSCEPSLSDNRHILFSLRGSILVHLIRNPRGTNWDSFKEGLKDRLEQCLEMNVIDEAGLGLSVRFVQQVVISACEDSCPLQPVNTGTFSPK